MSGISWWFSIVGDMSKGVTQIQQKNQRKDCWIWLVLNKGNPSNLKRTLSNSHHQEAVLVILISTAAQTQHMEDHRTSQGIWIVAPTLQQIWKITMICFSRRNERRKNSSLVIVNI